MKKHLLNKDEVIIFFSGKPLRWCKGCSTYQPGPGWVRRCNQCWVRLGIVEVMKPDSRGNYYVPKKPEQTT